MTDDIPDFTQLDDPALISRRAEMMAELDRLPPPASQATPLATLPGLADTGHGASLQRTPSATSGTRNRSNQTGDPA
jgi:hypothetical protein